MTSVIGRLEAFGAIVGFHLDLQPRHRQLCLMLSHASNWQRVQEFGQRSNDSLKATLAAPESVQTRDQVTTDSETDSQESTN
jgi:hypothetical protein